MIGAAGYRSTRSTQPTRFANGDFASQRDALTSETPGRRFRDIESPYKIASDAWLHNRRSLTAQLGLDESSPTERIISEAYARWGPGLADHFLGEFAFVLWDPIVGRLIAARDPLGIRPLCYAITDDHFIFASEIAQLLRHPGVERRLRGEMVARYLVGDLAGAEDSFYEGIRYVPAGHVLEWKEGNSSATVSRYWDIEHVPPIEHGQPSEYVEHFLSVFTDAVGDRLESGPSTGISLSGGLDSGSIAAVAGAHPKRTGSTSSSLRAYSYAFHEYPSCDERSVSDRLAREYSIPVVHVTGDDAWPVSEFPEHPPDEDEPLIGPFRSLNRRLADAARADGVEMVLTGLRGDTMMGLGIAEYLDDLLQGRWLHVFRQLRAHSAATGSSVRRLLHVYVWREVAARLWPRHRATGLRSLVRRAMGREDPIPPWLNPDLARDMENLGTSDRFEVEGSSFARRERIAAIISTSDAREFGWLDRLYSRSGIRMTDPWSDRRIAEFAAAVPQSILNAPGADKMLLRQAMHGVMPEEVRQQASKGSLRPLFDAGLRKLGASTVRRLLTGMVAADMGFVLEEALRTRYESYASGGPSDFRLWWAITLEMWLRAHWSAH